MFKHEDAFNVVKDWWGDKPVTPDTRRLNINLDSRQGAFESFILAILYSIEDPGDLAENTFKALQKQGLTDIDLLSFAGEGSEQWKSIVATFEQYYAGRLKNWKTRYITDGARSIAGDGQLRGDLRNLYSSCGGDERRMLARLWQFAGLQKKSLWIMREMRMQGVWNVDGKYCCVPDKQVGSSLERWNKISGWDPEQGKLEFLLKCSKIVWGGFGDLYDGPILAYAQKFKCNNKRLRQCRACSIIACNARTAADALPENEGNEKEVRMSDDNREQELLVWLPTHAMELLKKLAEDDFDISVPKLAQIWIMERLKQLHAGFPLLPSESQCAAKAQATSSGRAVYLRGILDGPSQDDWPLGLRINKTNSVKLPWNQSPAEILFVINDNPHEAVLRIYTGFDRFKSEGAYIKADRRFDNDLNAMGLNRLNPVELEADGVRNTLTVTRKLVEE